MSVVYAPGEIIEKIIWEQPVLQNLIGNGRIELACIDPKDRKIFILGRD